MRICMASDFIHPSIGGVEEHIYNLTQILLNHGHKVIILTHSYGNCKGIRYLTGGLKIYYLPIKVFYNQCILPTLICNAPLIRSVLLRERIEIVHGHSAFSALAHEAMTIGKLLGLKTVFTDHSLFGFADLSAVFTNKILEVDLSIVNHCICVSHIGKENTVLRAKVPQQKVSVIPNAVDATLFVPDITKRPSDGSINIIVASRLVYRKGVDLLANVIPRFKNSSRIRFIIAGDGPKRDLLEEIREKANMQDRVEIIGAVEHSKVRDILVRGHIFINTSLTEAYCITIVEAAACGLQIVSTHVGGIPEVLPPNLIILTEPDVDSIYKGLKKAIARCDKNELNKRRQSGNLLANKNEQNMENEFSSFKNSNLLSNDIFNSEIYLENNVNNRIPSPNQCNKIVTSLYNWENITHRTEKVYNGVLLESNPKLGGIISILLKSSVWPFLLLVSMCYLVLQFLEYLRPRNLMEKTLYSKDCHKKSNI